MPLEIHGFEILRRIAVEKVVEINSMMKKLLSSTRKNLLFRLNKRKIIDEIDAFFEECRLYEHNGEKCFSAENYFESPSNKTVDSDSLNCWEWDTNEIYLEKSIIGKQFKEAVALALERIEFLLLQHFPGNTFYIALSAQYGALRNINIRIYLNRGKPYVDSDIEEYNQPVLNEIFTT